jgi:cytoskeleton protein RodZ
MESVGQKLRATRLQLGLSLEDISAKTRISIRNLHALESDDVSPIASPFFYKSFVRQVAQQLKLDYKELAEAVQTVTSAMPQPLMPGEAQIATPLPKVPALRSGRPKKLRWLYSFTSLIAMLIACSSFYGTWRNSRPQLQAMLTGLIPSLNGSAQHAPAGRKELQLAAGAASVPEQKPVAQAAPAESGVFHVELSALEPTWLSIVADGRQTFDGVLEAAQKQTLEGREMARVRTGNAGGLNVVYNGKPIGSLGAHGQVRTVVFTPAGYETVNPPVTPAAHLTFTQFIPNGE